MKKGVLLCVLLALSGTGHAVAGDGKAYTGPDCSKDTDGRIFGGLWDSLSADNSKYKNYADILAKKDTTLKVTRLSSERIDKKEAERLMFRSAARDGYDKKDVDLKPGGSRYGMYIDEYMYRQYYLIESNKGFKAIAEFYSAYNPGRWRLGDKKAEACAADLENIFIISDRIYGHTSDFATH